MSYLVDSLKDRLFHDKTHLLQPKRTPDPDEKAHNELSHVGPSCL